MKIRILLMFFGLTNSFAGGVPHELVIQSQDLEKYGIDVLQKQGFKPEEAAEMMKEGRLFFQSQLTVSRNDKIDRDAPYVQRTYDRSLIRYLIPIDERTFRSIQDKDNKPQFISINLGLDGRRQNVSLLRVDGDFQNQELTGREILNGHFAGQIRAFWPSPGRDYAPMVFAYRSTNGFDGWRGPLVNERDGKFLPIADALNLLRQGGHRLDYGREFGSPSPLFHEDIRPLMSALKKKGKDTGILFGGFRVDEEMDMQKDQRTVRPVNRLERVSRIRKPDAPYVLTRFIQNEALEAATGLFVQNRVTLPSLPAPLGRGIIYSPEFLASVGLKNFNPKKAQPKRGVRVRRNK